MASPDPRYDLAAELMRLAPGYVLQREMLDAAAAQYAANGYTPLTANQAQAICLAAGEAIEAAEGVTTPPLPPQYPATIPFMDFC